MIHVLWQGQCLCGEMQGVPRDWPKGNVWVGPCDIPGPYETEGHDVCETCRLRAEVLRGLYDQHPPARVCQRYEIFDDPPAIRCNVCGRISWHPEDVKNKYCGHCHEFMSEREL